MTAEALPAFPYHLDPVATGAIERLPGTCRCCGQARGWLLSTTPYAVEDLREALCPWCVADGSAAARFDASFNDLSDSEVPPEVPAEVVVEIEQRTPGFAAWQPEQWRFHCGDGAAFVAAVGWPELADLPDAIASVRADIATWGWPENQIDAFLEALDVDGSPTAYLFRCRRCGTHLAYADMD